MGLEEIVNQIVSFRSDLKTEKIQELIKKKKNASGNFLTDETAARIVASELGVKILKPPACFNIQIKDLFSGLNDVSLIGQVVSVFPPKTFKRRDWTEGKIANLRISDNSGTLKVVLWDKKTDLVQTKNIQRDQTIKIYHGYVREGLDGKPELHMGNKGTIEVLNKNTKKLGEITETKSPLIVEGTISTTPNFKEVMTSKKEKVKITSFYLTDSTQKLAFTAWRKLAEEVKEMKIGTKIKIINVYAKKGYKNKIELFSRSSTIIEVLD
ncbi:hypothetical protein KJN74_03675 [Candidatus Bathyarchaeota archaeon]|nr:hypothetical protein [Candidatus Bathyarchaeota archaeon]